MHESEISTAEALYLLDLAETASRAQAFQTWRSLSCTAWRG